MSSHAVSSIRESAQQHISSPMLSLSTLPGHQDHISGNRTCAHCKICGMKQTQLPWVVAPTETGASASGMTRFTTWRMCREHREQVVALTWREAYISDRLVMPGESVHELAGGYIEDHYCAIHDPTRQALPIWAEGHAQHKLFPLVLLICLQEQAQAACC